jgi:hypothetical protein
VTTLYPTHHCFDDALDFIGERVKVDPGLVLTLQLVHAIVLTPREQLLPAPADVVLPPADEPFAHAWVEETINGVPVVWVSGLTAPRDGARVFVAIPWVTFYATMRVQQATVYTCREACEENRRSGTYGPWRPEYRALCGRRATSHERN